MYKAISCICKFCKREKSYSVNLKESSKNIFCSYCNGKLGIVSELLDLEEVANEKKEALAKKQEEFIRLQTLKAKENFLKSIPKEIELLHFTDIRNIESIYQHGLISWENLEKKPLNYSREKDYFPSSDPPSREHIDGLSRTLDKAKGYTNYVRLCKNRNHEMIQAAKNRGNKLCLLKVKIEAIYELECLFADDNATATTRPVQINKNYKTFIKSDKNQAEVLVENCVPLEYIDKKWIRI